MSYDNNTVQWEYLIEIIQADPNPYMSFVQQFYPGGQVPMYAVQAILPRLNQLGELGWELIQALPVRAGNNGDVLVDGGNNREWARSYLCSFKRVKQIPS